MLNALLNKFNTYRKERYFQSPLFLAQKRYAFVGFGVHSMTNLYPVLRHFNVHLKYICTKQTDWQPQLAPLFPGCIFTHDLEAIATDPEVAGVFVCANPEAHYEILTRLLKAGKAVFIEKPPCRTLAQLDQLRKSFPEAICTVGLQRRHWPGTTAVQKKCHAANNYLYQFQTGPLSQGDPFTELFIHPLDYAQFLFGPAQLRSVVKQTDSRGITLQLHLSHPGDISGLLHLSTRHTWNPPLECLTVNTTDESITIQFPTSVTGTKMPFRVMNIPTERLMRQPTATKEYFSGMPTIVPAMETNSLFVQGFLPELGHFVSLVENPGNTKPGEANDLDTLAPVYQLMEKLTQPTASL